MGQKVPMYVCVMWCPASGGLTMVAEVKTNISKILKDSTNENQLWLVKGDSVPFTHFSISLVIFSYLNRLYFKYIVFTITFFYFILKVILI